MNATPPKRDDLSMRLFYVVYRWIGWPILRGALEIAARFAPKIARGLDLRRSVQGRAPWIKSLPPSPPTVWFHCASGEFEYAKPVLTLLKARAPETKIVVTYFSPSYADMIRKFSAVDWVVPLPWDTRRDLTAFLNSYRPSALLVARTDVWPEMAAETRRRGLRSALFSASLTSRSGRTRGVGRWATRATLNQLDAIFCVSDEDVGAFRDLALPGPEISRLGDTRYDQVLARLADPKPLREEVFKALADRELMVCGSTWPEDEAVLIPALAGLRRAGSRLTGCLVPHEPTPAHLAAIDSALAAQGLRGVRYSDPQAPELLRSRDSVLVVDQMGLLAELYAKARWAFVGGSFKKNAHSVMEPLAAGCVTFVGPMHENNREALAFKSLRTTAGNGHYVEVVRSAAEIEAVLAKWAGEADVRDEIRAEIRARTGSSRAVVDWLFTER